MTELPSVSKPAWFGKFPKVIKVSLKDVTSKTDAETECFICMTERLTCSRVKVPVTSNKMKTVTQIVLVEVKVPKTSILLGYFVLISLFIFRFTPIRLIAWW